MATAVWKGSLTFGLAAVPIRLYTAARSERLNLHQLVKQEEIDPIYFDSSYFVLPEKEGRRAMRCC
jgi:non-homologous end joining protein Ku